MLRAYLKDNNPEWGLNVCIIRNSVDIGLMSTQNGWCLAHEMCGCARNLHSKAGWLDAGGHEGQAGSHGVFGRHAGAGRAQLEGPELQVGREHSMPGAVCPLLTAFISNHVLLHHLPR